MILKSFQLEKLDIQESNFYLLYGENEGFKNQIISKKFKENYDSGIYIYEEKEVLSEKENFFNNILSKSFFENKKLIIIQRVSDKIKDFVDELITRKIDDIKFVLVAAQLDKKSNLRKLFEKDKSTICIAFYADTNQALSFLASNFFKKNKIPISQQNINLLVERCRGDRQNLNNELAKLESFNKNRKNIETEDIFKLTNLAENYNASELIDNCLSKNSKRTLNILNENNYSIEDCILIIRTFLIKLKKLYKIHTKIKETKNIDQVISSFKPPIFWKDKDTIKYQISVRPLKEIEELIYRSNEVELMIKRNSINSLNILSDFIIEQANSTNNSI